MRKNAQIENLNQFDDEILVDIESGMSFKAITARYLPMFKVVSPDLVKIHISNLMVHGK